MKFFFWDREVIGAPTITRKGWCSPDLGLTRNTLEANSWKDAPSLQYGNFEVFLEGFPNSSENVGILERQSQR